MPVMSCFFAFRPKLWQYFSEMSAGRGKVCYFHRSLTIRHSILLCLLHNLMESFLSWNIYRPLILTFSAHASQAGYGAKCWYGLFTFILLKKETRLPIPRYEKSRHTIIWLLSFTLTKTFWFLSSPLCHYQLLFRSPDPNKLVFLSSENIYFPVNLNMSLQKQDVFAIHFSTIDWFRDIRKAFRIQTIFEHPHTNLDPSCMDHISQVLRTYSWDL